MARSDQPTLRVPYDPDSEHAPDLPLTSIPSVPDNPMSDEERPRTPRLLAGAALFALIVTISVLGARYLKMPRATAPAEPPTVAESVLPAPAPAPAEVEPQAAPPEIQAPVLPAREPEPDPELLAARSDLASERKALGEARRALERERELRRTAERKLENGVRPVKAAPAPREDRKALARAKELARKVVTLEGQLKAARQESAAVQSARAAHDAELGALGGKLAAAEAKEKEATARLNDAASRHDRALQGESEAVRKLLADLTAARESSAKDQAARREAERKLRELQAEVYQQAKREAAPSLRPKPAPASAPPAVAAAERLVEPERVKTVPPRYPDELRRAGVAGRVRLRVLVDEAGSVADVEVTDSPHSQLAAVAADAARRWEYTPGRRDGLRAKMWVAESVDFKL